MEDAVGVIAVTMSEQDLAKKFALRQSLIASDGKFNQWITAFTTLLNKNGTGYFVGNNLTIADLKYFTFLDWFSTGKLGTHIVFTSDSH